MYYFNFLLFKKLNSLLGITQKELSMKVFGTEFRYRQKIENQGRISVSDMVDICNKLQISISNFITLNPDSYYRDKVTEYVINSTVFKPIVFDSSRINRMYGKGGLAGDINKRDFAERMGVSVTSIYLWINQDTCTMRLNQLIDMCNEFGVNIGEFIIDPNIPLPLNDVVKGTQSAGVRKSLEELRELRAIVSNDQQTIAALNRELESLRLSVSGRNVAEEQITCQKADPALREWVFNKPLLDAMPGLLLSSRRDVMKGLGMSNASISYNDGDVTVQLIVDLCNRYRISSKHFFVRKNEDVGNIRELSFYQTLDFQPIVFHPEHVGDIFGRNSLTGLSLCEVLKQIGYSEQKVRNWRDIEKSTLRVNDLANLCNVLSVTPSCFITDNNRTTSVYGVTTAEYFLEESRLATQENMRLREEIKLLKKKKKGHN